MEIKVKNAVGRLSEIDEIMKSKWLNTEISKWSSAVMSIIGNDVVIKGEDNQIGWANILMALAHKGFDVE